MKAKLFLSFLMITVSAFSFAQIADKNAQEKNMRDYSNMHESYNTSSGSHVERDSHSVKETWTSGNGDKNTIEKNTDTGEVHTTVEHPNGSVERDGREVERETHEAPDNEATEHEAPDHDAPDHEAPDHNASDHEAPDHEPHEAPDHDHK